MGGYADLPSTPAGSNTRLRKERSSTPSLDVLRARLNSPSVHAEGMRCLFIKYR